MADAEQHLAENAPLPVPHTQRRPVSFLPRPKKVGEDETRTGAQKDCYGFTFGSPAERETNFTPVTNFRITPIATVELEDGQGIECTVDTTSGNQFKVVLDVENITERSVVVKQVQRQARAGKCRQMIIAQGLRADDWATYSQQMMRAFMRKQETEPVEKVPIDSIGMQGTLLPPNLRDLQPEHIEYFFNCPDGVRDSKGKWKPESKAALDPGRMKGAREVRYKPSGKKGFAAFLSDPLARGHGKEYMEGLVISVFSALFGWASPFNRHYFRKMATLIIEGPPCTGKSFRAQLALVLGSSIAHFYSGSSTVAGMQEALSMLSLLAVIDDLESRKKEEKVAILDFEQTRTQTVSGGGRSRLAPIMITMNGEELARKKKQLSGRCVIIPCQNPSYKEPKESLQKVVDLIVVNTTIQAPDKPWDFLMEKFHELFFKFDDIPLDMREHLQDYNLISGKETTCRRYLLLLAKTCNEIQLLCPTKVWREVLAHGLLFMWAKAIDLWIADLPNNKWFIEGGSAAFFSKYLTSYYAVDEATRAAGEDADELERSFKEDFLEPVLETLKSRSVPEPIPLGDACSDLWIVTKKGTSEVSIFFRQPGRYKDDYRTKFELKHYRNLFQQWQANFQATASTRQGSKRGWAIQMVKIPQQLILPLCEQTQIKDSYGFHMEEEDEEENRGGTTRKTLEVSKSSVRDSQMLEEREDLLVTNTDSEGAMVGGDSEEDLDGDEDNFYRRPKTSTQKKADLAFTESPILHNEWETETMSCVSQESGGEEEDKDQGHLFGKPKRKGSRGSTGENKGKRGRKSS